MKTNSEVKPMGEEIKTEIKAGMLIAYQSVKEEMDTIKIELKRKGIEENKGFSVKRGEIRKQAKTLISSRFKDSGQTGYK